MLRGRRLVVSLELGRRAVLAEGLIKAITGGDRISARYLFGQRFDFEPTHTFVIVTNHLPRVHGTDEAIWRRLRVVPFTVTIPPADRIPDFGKLLAELHGQAILAWLVDGAVDYYRNGLREAEQVRQATFDYRQSEDVFAQFLAECTVEIIGRTAVKALRLGVGRLGEEQRRCDRQDSGLHRLDRSSRHRSRDLSGRPLCSPCWHFRR